MSVESALEQKRLARHNLLLDCKIQELPVTLMSGDLAEISEVQVGAAGPPVFPEQLQWSSFPPLQTFTEYLVSEHQIPPLFSSCSLS